MSKKVKIETHGKIEGAPTTLEQVWGFNEYAKYGTLDEEEYSAQVVEMNRTDLETHARKVGVVVVESTARLRDNLVREFRRYVTYLRKPETKAVDSTSHPTIPDDIKKILAEGR